MIALPLVVLLAASAPAPARTLRVCADPNNLPFSNQRREGFENKIAALLGEALKAQVEFVFWPQRRAFARQTLKSKACDLWVSVPVGYGPVRTTRPYYRSSYAFVYPKAKGLKLRSFDDPALKQLRIGVQIVGDDYADTPPAEALAKRGLARQVRGYTVYGDYAKESPALDVLAALRRGEIDVAVAWGPQAGYFAHEHPELQVVPVEQTAGDQPMSFAIAVGTRKDDAALARELDEALVTLKPKIDAVLDAYGIPRS